MWGMDLEGRVARLERRLDATLKVVQTGMKMLVKLEEGMVQSREETRQFRDETRRAIDALIAAQLRSDARVDRLVAAMRRTWPNGRGN